MFNIPNHALLLNVTHRLASILNSSTHHYSININVIKTPFTIQEARHPKFKPFWPILTQSEKAVLLDLADKMSQTCSSLKIPCMMYGGSLLGSYRHHDIIPWDDDIDMFVDIKHRGLISRELEMISDDYQVENAGARLKFFSVHGQKHSKYPWNWPYIDISFYRENDTHILDTSKDMRKYIYPKTVIFPVHKRPLGNVLLDAPFDSYAALKLTYNSKHCQTYFYSHKYEKKVSNSSHVLNCREMKSFYGFVHRVAESDGGGVQETLIKGNTRLHAKFVPEPPYAISKPYILDLL
jgi:hypothetical protein